MKKTLLTLSLLLIGYLAGAKSYTVTSPDGNLVINVDVDKTLAYSLKYKGAELVSPSPISMTIQGAKAFGVDSKVKSALVARHEGSIKTVAYKKNVVSDNYNELTLRFKEKFNLILRAYNEGAAYRFVSTSGKPVIVEGEQANFNFAKDWQAYVPYVKYQGTQEEQFNNSFENTYTHTALSKLNAARLAFLPFIVEADGGVKMCVTEADLEDYPGMYVNNASAGTSLKGVSAPYPKEVKQDGHNMLQQFVISRHDYLAKSKAGACFPWRVINVSSDDKQLLDNDMVYRLASPARFSDTSWIKPGKVAWDWWNDWGIYGVDFKTGVNTKTYKAYIDFANRNKIEYVILDEGWAVNLKADLMQVVPEIDLKEILGYAKSKNVGIILWAGYYAFDRDMENVCKHYSEMGVKGFKIDFMDRDDAQSVNFHYRAAAMAAKYHLMVDFHGSYKPTGIARTYPNVVNFEGVDGQEQNKWSTIEQYDQVNYDVTMPYMRMLAGQIDYTQGAMLNGTRYTFRPNNSQPMSQGTRCHQLAEYTLFFSPLNMLCDSPTNYEKEPECTGFIAAIPSVWDETVALAGKIGEYAAVARRSGNTWYVGVINNWTERDLTIDLSFLGTGNMSGEAFCDGPNADRFAQDYLKKTIQIPQDRKLSVHLAPGGGFTMKIVK